MSPFISEICSLCLRIFDKALYVLDKVRIRYHLFPASIGIKTRTTNLMSAGRYADYGRLMMQGYGR
jgi:hypothetical protein